MGTQKANCQIFTPPKVVKKMLDILGYTKNLYGNKVLENSCGDGRFLTEIVRRYIEDCRLNGFSDKEICDGLTQDIWAYEIDKDTYNKCIQNLDQVVKEYSISDVNWSVFNADFLQAKLPIDFSFVVGNPPYITYSALSEDSRVFIRKTFTVCKEGKPDYYYAFIESALKCLNKKGRLVYLLPSNFFKTKYASRVRTLLLPFLTDIYDYKGQKIFESAMIASAVIVYDKSIDLSHVVYHDVADDVYREFEKNTLKERWIFNTTDSKKTTKTMTRFGDHFTASSSIATLYNDAFIINAGSPELKQIEPKVIRKAVSPKSKLTKQDERIIFPYYFDKTGSLKRYSEKYFISRFPFAAAHLQKYRESLDARDKDKNAAWFEYGRSQAIRHMNQDKLLLSTIITGKVKVTLLNKKAIPYSGIYIIAKNGSSLADAKRILESQSFLEYAKEVGVHVNGTSIRISIRDINNYMFNL